jgi:Tol biopolymer transport system component
VPLTSYPGDEGPPAISPDGNLVAFTCRDVDPVLEKWGQPYGKSDICLKAVGTESIRRLTETPHTELHPTWSPDGKEIAFARAPGGVFVVSHLGGHERKISSSDTGTHPCWSPDGNSILVRDRAGERSWAIYSIALDTLGRRQLTFPSAGVREWDFDVSPDGNTLAFIRFERSRVGDIYVVSMQGGEPRRLTDWNAAVESVTWTPDGRELIYGVAGRLWRIPGNGARIGRGSPVPDIPMHATQASISRTGPGHGARLVFRTLTQETGMRLIDLDAGTADGTIEAVHPISRASRNSIPGAFSPDGSKIAFTSDRGSTGPNLWVVNREDRAARQITFLETPAMGVPSWSPDGARIAFDAVVDGNTDVYAISVDGGKPVRLTSGPSIDDTPEWSPDGKWIYFSSSATGPRPDVWRAPAEGGTPEQITHGGGFQARMSPDGEYFYYLDRPPETAGSPMEVARLLRVPMGGGEATLIHERIPPFYWSVSSRGIFFLAGDLSPTSELYRLREGKVVHIGRLPFRLAVSPGGMAVSRDGRWALVSALHRNEADLMLLENFR